MFEVTKVVIKLEVAEDKNDVYDITLNYIARGRYPLAATKQDKCVIRKRAKQYKCRMGSCIK